MALPFIGFFLHLFFSHVSTLQIQKFFFTHVFLKVLAAQSRLTFDDPQGL